MVRRKGLALIDVIVGSAMLSIGLGVVISMSSRSLIQQADAEQAYIQADLQGATTWVMLPEELWPEDWWVVSVDGPRTPKYDKPVVILKKALYGHPDAGTYWEMHLT